MSDVSEFRRFDSLFKTFTLRTPPDAPHFESVLVLPSQKYGSDPNSGDPFLYPETRLWFDIEKSPGFNAFVKKLKVWLSCLGLPTSNSAVSATLGVLAVASDHEISEVLEKLESSVREADISHFVLLNTNLPDSWKSSIQWDGFELGPLNTERLKYRCERAGDPIEVEILQHLAGKPAISSPVYRRNVLDVVSFLEPFCTDGLPVSKLRLAYGWFETIQPIHLEEMWCDFEDRRALIYALGYGLTDGDTFRHFPDQLRFSCYLNLRKSSKNEGLVVSGLWRPILVLPDLRESRTAILKISSVFSSEEIEASSLSGAIKSFASTLCRGTRIGLEGHSSEAFIYHIIALEDLFSAKEKISQMVSGRVAALVHRQTKTSFSDCKKKLIEIYEARSRFVHSGIQIPETLFEPIYEITQAVLRSLLWLAKDKSSRSKEFRERWIKRLDWFIASHEAEFLPSDEILNSIGIIEAETFEI